jgi:hypothetical protein
MAAVYARSLNSSGTYSVTRSSCSDLLRPGKKMNCSPGKWHDSAGEICLQSVLFITLPISNKLIGRLSCGKAEFLLVFGMAMTFASFRV